MTKFTLSHFLFGLTALFISTNNFAQSTGFINRQATSTTGKAILDPNGDGYTSASTSGFAGNDVTNSEISFKSVRSYAIEPYGDLRRGPSHLYSDFVPDANSNGYYSYYDGTNLLFRWRMGSVMSGSKGYSVMLDTDGKFGATGTNADPNYQPATTGTNGNPGFEIEIVLETNFRIAIYNVDGANSGTLIKQYTNWQDMSQISIAATSDNGDPDFLIDFYIPFSDLTSAPFNLTASTSLRMSATTVMSPQGAIGGPKSDLYGLNDANYSSTNAQYEAFMQEQSPVTVANLGSAGSGFGTRCTAAPKITGGVGTGTVTISGTWTKSSLSGSANSATITVYNNGVSAGTVPNVTSGTIWSLPGVTVVSGNVITAKAQAAGESMCLSSEPVTAQGCNTSNIPSSSGLTITCISTRGIEGTYLSGNQVKIYWIDPATLAASKVGGPAASSPTFGYSGTNFYYNHTSYNGSQIPSACSGGSQDMSDGSFYVTTIAPGSTCESAPVFGCVTLSNTATPTIAQTTLYNTATTISGTAAANAQVRLRINGQLIGTTTATGGNYSFTGLALTVGDAIEVRAITTGTCMSASVSKTVVCYSTPPVITVDNNNQITAGAAITGTSGESAGTTIRVYTSAAVLVATTTVQANGTWSTGNAGTTPATYNAVAATTYYATAQNGSCGLSANSSNATAVAATSNARCGTITGPVTAAAASVSGTVTGSVASTTVNLYMDGINIGSTTTGNTSWSVTVAANSLYPNGTLTIGILESGKQEVLCSASVVVGCAVPPTAPIVTPANANIVQNQTITYTISNAVAGNFYGIADGTTGKSLASGAWATSNGNLNITTDVFGSSGNYNVVVKATSLSGLSVCTSTPGAATVAVNGLLPVHFISVTANKVANGTLVKWTVANEKSVNYYAVERSSDCIHFTEAGRVAYDASAAFEKTYSFTDHYSNSGKMCYRIREMDIDGNSQYSNVIVVGENVNAMLQVGPNPAKDRVEITLRSSIEENALIEIVDLNGRTVRSQKIGIRPGSNVISVGDLGGLTRGSYVLKLSRASGGYHHKLILQ